MLRTLFDALFCIHRGFGSCQENVVDRTRIATYRMGEDVKEKVGEAVETTKEYIRQQSEEYRKKLEKQFEEFD